MGAAQKARKQQDGGINLLHSWIPVAGPLVGGLVAALCFVLMY